MSKPLAQRWLECLSRLSLRNQYRLAKCFALAIRLIPNQVSRQAQANIRLCFADAGTAEQQRLYRETLRHTCYASTELAAVWCWPVERVLGLITTTEVCPEFENSSRARIILAPHLGCWEIMAQWLGRHYQAMFLYKRRKNRVLDAYVNQSRARTGGEPVPTKKRGLRKLLVGLKENRCLMILPDQRPARNRAFIESTFFGHDAPTTTVVHNLCRKMECDVFIATMYRSNPPGEFGLRIEALDYERLAGEEKESALYMNESIEQLVRQYPEQYQWGYRRFKSTAFQSLQK